MTQLTILKVIDLGVKASTVPKVESCMACRHMFSEVCGEKCIYMTDTRPTDVMKRYMDYEGYVLDEDTEDI